MGAPAQFLAAVAVGNGQAEKANGDGDENEISHALVSRGFDTKPSGVEERSPRFVKMS